MQGEGEVLGAFVPHFHYEKCHWVADGEMFLIRMQKLDNISVCQMYHWKARFVGFLVIYSVSTSMSGFMRNEQKMTITLPKLKCKQQTVAACAEMTAAVAADGQLAYSRKHAVA